MLTETLKIRLEQLVDVARRFYSMHARIVDVTGTDKHELFEIERLENEIDEMTSELPEMRNFILPGGHPEVSYCHIARSVCRRTERLAVALGNEESMNDFILIYLNRLSDFLFTLARKMAAEHGVVEIPWKPGK